MKMNKEPVGRLHLEGGMLVFDGGGGGGGGSLVFQQGLDSSQGVRQSRKGVGTIQCRWRSVSYQIFIRIRVQWVIEFCLKMHTL